MNKLIKISSFVSFALICPFYKKLEITNFYSSTCFQSAPKFFKDLFGFKFCNLFNFLTSQQSCKSKKPRFSFDLSLMHGKIIISGSRS